MTGAGQSRRTQVFISYSHKDSAWLERLQVHLRPLERAGVLERWDDTRLLAGSDWREEIRQAIERARVAVLLISADFLGSEFITENELPPLLTAAQKDGALIIPVIVNPSRFVREPELSRFQAVNAPSRPLSSLSTHEQEKVLDQVAERIEVALKGASAAQPAYRSETPLTPQTKEARADAMPTPDLAALFTPDGRLLVLPLSKVEVGEQVVLHLEPESGEEAAALRALKPSRRDLFGIAFGDTVLEAILDSVTQLREGGADRWVMRFTHQDKHYSIMSDGSFNNYSADQLAEMRARRILLDEKLPPWVANDHMLDMFVSGAGTGANRLVVKGSPLPLLYKSTDRYFVAVARLVALLWLRLSEAVDEVHRLDLALEGDELHVDFKGRRPRVYQNREPAVIEVKGVCKLA